MSKIPVQVAISTCDTVFQNKYRYQIVVLVLVSCTVIIIVVPHTSIVQFDLVSPKNRLLLVAIKTVIGAND